MLRLQMRQNIVNFLQIRLLTRTILCSMAQVAHTPHLCSCLIIINLPIINTSPHFLQVPSFRPRKSKFSPSILYISISPKNRKRKRYGQTTLIKTQKLANIQNQNQLVYIKYPLLLTQNLPTPKKNNNFHLPFCRNFCRCPSSSPPSTTDASISRNYARKLPLERRSTAPRNL